MQEARDAVKKVIKVPLN